MTDTETLENQIVQLQQQQAFFTASLAALLEGRFTGADSVEAYTYALDPGLQGTLTLDPPVAQSELSQDTPPKG